MAKNKAVPDELLTTAEAARMLGIAPKTLRNWAHALEPKGPTPHRQANAKPKARLYYWRSDVQKHMQKRALVPVGRAA